MKKLALITATLLLSACGGSHHRDHDGNQDMPPVVPPVTTLDTFYSAVLAIVSNTPEDSEPAAIDGIVATAPENTEPVAQ
jgi:hypothetical protein